VVLLAAACGSSGSSGSSGSAGSGSSSGSSASGGADSPEALARAFVDRMTARDSGAVALLASSDAVAAVVDCPADLGITAHLRAAERTRAEHPPDFAGITFHGVPHVQERRTVQAGDIWQRCKARRAFDVQDVVIDIHVDQAGHSIDEHDRFLAIDLDGRWYLIADPAAS
jgi:hypothetical protein